MFKPKCHTLLYGGPHAVKNFEPVKGCRPNNRAYFDRQWEQVDLFQRGDFTILYQTAKLGDWYPFFFGFLASATAATASTSSATGSSPAKSTAEITASFCHIELWTSTSVVLRSITIIHIRHTSRRTPSWRTHDRRGDDIHLRRNMLNVNPSGSGWIKEYLTYLSWNADREKQKVSERERNRETCRTLNPSVNPVPR